jgi:hypothetical protein
MITHITVNEHYGVRLGFYTSREEALQALAEHFHEEVERLDPRDGESEDDLEERTGEFYHLLDKQDHEAAWKWLQETFSEAEGIEVIDLSIIKSGLEKTWKRRLH